MRLGDGRNFLLTTPNKYDLITSDTIQPYDAGSTNLYSADYYGLALNALAPGGIVAQWVGPFDDFQYKVMIRTFLSVFPHATLWLSSDLLIGSRDPITVDLAQVAKRFESPQARQAMKDAGFNGPEALSEWFVATGPELEAYVGEGPIWTDDRPIVEYFRFAPHARPGRAAGRVFVFQPRPEEDSGSASLTAAIPSANNASIQSKIASSYATPKRNVEASKRSYASTIG